MALDIITVDTPENNKAELRWHIENEEKRIRGNLHFTNRLQMWRYLCQTKNESRPKGGTFFEKIMGIGEDCTIGKML